MNILVKDEDQLGKKMSVQYYDTVKKGEITCEFHSWL